MTEPEKQALAADARNRSWRTVLQGLVAALVVAGFPIVQQAVAGGIENIDWKVLGVSLANTCAMAGLAYLWRRYLDPSRVPSAEPPS